MFLVDDILPYVEMRGIAVDEVLAKISKKSSLSPKHALGNLYGLQGAGLEGDSFILCLRRTYVRRDAKGTKEKNINKIRRIFSS